MRSIFVQSLLGVLILSGGFTAELWAQPKRTATVWLGNLNQTYDGSPRSATATSTAPGFSSFRFTYNGSPIAPTAAGSYNVICTLVNDKYEGRATGTLVISKPSPGITPPPLFQPNKTATVWLGNLNQTYNGSPRSATATSSAGGISRFDFTYNGSPIAPRAAGSYNVACKLANTNYQGSATGTLVISKASSTTTLTLSPPKATVGQTITLTAAVKSTSNDLLPAGNVTFKDGDEAMKTVGLTTINDVATATYSLNLTAGNHAFTAVYSGDTNFAGSTSARAQ
ncbi:MAG: MBG domain-containing protein [Thermoguttaceae bacterium]|jgi:hypothetical protein